MTSVLCPRAHAVTFLQSVQSTVQSVLESTICSVLSWDQVNTQPLLFLLILKFTFVGADGFAQLQGCVCLASARPRAQPKHPKYEKQRLKTRKAYRTYDGAKADTAYKDLTGDEEHQYM